MLVRAEGPSQVFLSLLRNRLPVFLSLLKNRLLVPKRGPDEVAEDHVHPSLSLPPSRHQVSAFQRRYRLWHHKQLWAKVSVQWAKVSVQWAKVSVPWANSRHRELLCPRHLGVG
tara:strand:+ start:444 stop:785 length:342 start_codon:yes stop_codon:yes gene_type:complete